jgi:hypothetical protein
MTNEDMGTVAGLRRLTLEAKGHDFNCDICGRRFVVDFDAYQGEFDHPPSVPVCDACADDCMRSADY